MKPKGLGAMMGGAQAAPAQNEQMPQRKGLEPQAEEGQNAPGAEYMPSPEAMKAYNKVYAFSLMYLYNDKFMPKAIQAIEDAPTPQAGVADVASTIGARVYFSAQKAGEDIPDEVMLLGGWQVIVEIADFAENHTNVGPLSQEQVEEAFMVASDELKAALDGKHNIGQGVPPEDVQRMIEMAGGEQGIQQMEQRKLAAQVPSEVRAKGVPDAQPDGGM